MEIGSEDRFNDGCRLSRLKYVDKIGCDYYVIKDNKAETLFWNKFRMYDICGGYDKALYIDADILITPNCPNVFEQIDSGVGLVSDYWNANCGEYEVKNRDTLDFNAGFLLCCSDSYEFFDKTTHKSILEHAPPCDWPGTQNKTAEQDYFRYKLKNSNIKFTQLKELWNYQPYFNDYAKDWDLLKQIRIKSNISRYQAYMIHYTLLKKLIKYDYEYFFNGIGETIMFDDIDKIK